MQIKVSTKRALIDKTQGMIVLVVAGAAFILVFTGFGAQALLSQAMYQNRVIGAKEKAVATLKEDIQSTNALVASYKGFVGTQQNKLGGNPSGSGPQDGDNAKITLDALPSKYDFPALATSLDKLLTSQNLKIQSITGTDDEVAQAASSEAAVPEPVPIPFRITVSGAYESMQNIVTVFDRSIRPFKLATVQFSGGEGEMTMTMTAETYYQPEKSFTLEKKVVK